MKTFNYTVTDPLGIHARPAAQLVALYKSLPCQIHIQYGTKEIDGKSLLALMTLQIKQNDTITFQLDGPGEDEAYTKINDFIKHHL